MECEVNMFKLFSSNTKNASANEELVAVTLKEGTAKAPFSKEIDSSLIDL